MMANWQHKKELRNLLQRNFWKSNRLLKREENRKKQMPKQQRMQLRTRTEKNGSELKLKKDGKSLSQKLHSWIS
jgi:hypothetical protein